MNRQDIKLDEVAKIMRDGAEAIYTLLLALPSRPDDPAFNTMVANCSRSQGRLEGAARVIDQIEARESLLEAKPVG